MIKKSTRFIVRPIILFISMNFMSAGFAETTIEQHPPHEHGAASLTIALDANKLAIALESPADNIFGFEYAPSSKEDKKKVKNAVKQLKNAKVLFSIPDNAQCHLDQVTVSSPMLEKSKGDKKDTVDSHSGTDEHNNAHGDGDEHHHVHNDVDASWAFTCQSVKNLDQITPHLFTVFLHGFKKLKVDWITSKGASSKLISEDKAIKLK